MAVVVIVATVVSPSPIEATGGRFKDTGGHWAEAFIVRAAERGLVGGNPDGTFAPQGTTTRAAFVKLMVQAGQFPLRSGGTSPFLDTASHWVFTQGYIGTAVFEGTVVPSEFQGSFYPDRPITREEMAVMAARVLRRSGVLPGPEVSPFADAAEIRGDYWRDVDFAAGLGIITGFEDRTFKPKDNATRAQAVVIALRVLDCIAAKGGQAGGIGAQPPTTGGLGAPGGPTVIVKGRPATLEAPPISAADAPTLLPMGSILRAAGCDVQWDAAAGRLTATVESNTIVMTTGAQAALVNGKAVPTDVAFRSEAGTLYAPWSYLERDDLGVALRIARSEWDHATNVVRYVEGTPSGGSSSGPIAGGPGPGVSGPNPDSSVPGASTAPDLPWQAQYAGRPDPATDGLTYTLPPNASPLRLSLPASIEDIFYSPHTGVAGFGLHAGGHVEGLDHVWIELKPGTPVKSWAGGVVRDVRLSGDLVNGEYQIVIDYGQNLVGRHMEIRTPYVKKGDTVTRGQLIGLGMSYGPDGSSAEFQLEDQGRRDGVKADRGVYVSPYDYLEAADKAKLIDAYKRYVLDPYLAKKAAGPVNLFDIDDHLLEPYQPFLTNELLLHAGHPGKLTGEWLLNQKWAAGYPNELLTFIEADPNNPYYQDNVVLAMDEISEGQADPWSIHGTFEVDYVLGRVKMVDMLADFQTYYGIFTIDESGDRAKLKIEYQTGRYPTEFTAAALEYIQRGPMPRREEGFLLGLRDSR